MPNPSTKLKQDLLNFLEFGLTKCNFQTTFITNPPFQIFYIFPFYFMSLSYNSTCKHRDHSPNWFYACISQELSQKLKILNAKLVFSKYGEYTLIPFIFKVYYFIPWFIQIEGFNIKLRPLTTLNSELVAFTYYF